MCLEISLSILRTILVYMHISLIDLNVTNHPTPVIRSCVTWLLLEFKFSSLFLFSKISFPKQNSFSTKFNTFHLKVTAKYCKQLIPLMVLQCLRNYFGQKLKEIADWGYNWIVTPFSFQRRPLFITDTSNRHFKLTLREFVRMCNPTMKNVRFWLPE